MSVEIGVPSKTIRYLNLSKEGIPGENNECHIDSRWTTPLLDKLDDYMVAVTRFEVPANRLTMTQKLEDCIKIYKYPETPHFAGNRNIEEVWSDVQTINYFLDGDAITPGLERTDEFIMTKDTSNVGNAITVGACHTIYQFIKELNAQINESLLFNTGDKKIIPNGGPNFTSQASSNAEHTNMFCQSGLNVTGQNKEPLNTTDPIAYFKIEMDSDWRFRVVMNYSFAQKYYIKMSPALFNMLGFQEMEPTSIENYRTCLVKGRFMGSRRLRPAVTTTNKYKDMLAQKPPYVEISRSIPIVDKKDRIYSGLAGTNTLQQGGGYGLDTVHHCNNDVLTHRTMITSFVAPVSVADSINRVKSLVFSSSMATSSEAGTGGTYMRMLTDYTIPVRTSFSFDPSTMATGTVSENAASEYSYNNANPSAGRFLQITDPSPLYELKIQVLAKVYDFENDVFKFESIPLPIGGTFTVKLVFISKNEIHRRERPDAMKP